LLIPATVLSLNDIDAQIAEIDENFVRNELSVLERGEQLKRRKELYEAKYPQTKAGVAGATASNKAQGKNDATPESGVASFAKDVAAKTGRGVSTIKEDVQIASRIAEPVKETIRNTPLADNKSQLLEMTRYAIF
jgi:ParB family chromosome partitioning protein